MKLKPIQIPDTPEGQVLHLAVLKAKATLASEKLNKLMEAASNSTKNSKLVFKDNV